jgi:L-ascorbate metabolism protein UlaG (beta-lactamase superfamily)
MKNLNYLFISIFLLFIISACGDKCTSSPTINAGNDTIIYNANALVLNAATDAEAGQWSIVSGVGGVLENALLPTTKFTGAMNNDYDLVWRSENDCGLSTDTLKVSFKSKFTTTQMVDSLVWVQQSCFQMKGTGVIVYTDPQSIKAGSPMADVILITHSHGDHFSPSEIKKIANEKTLIYGPADCKYSGTCKEFVVVKPGETKSILPNLSFKAVNAYNIVKVGYHSKSMNWLGYVVSLDGVSIYHCGDTERIPEMKEIDCDIALMTLGQTYTMSTVQEAVDAVKDVKAEVAIPMHYGMAEGILADAQLFKSLLNGFAEVVIKTRQ